jgi:AraC-like DNA-binding protein
MLTSDPNSKARRDLIEVPETSSALPMDLVRALGWLRGHLSEPIQLGQLAQVGGVRARTLETHFKIFLRTTPLGCVAPDAARACPSRTAPIRPAGHSAHSIPRRPLKKSVHAAEQDWDDVTAAHDAFRKEQPTLDLKRLVFIDETAACLA